MSIYNNVRSLVPEYHVDVGWSRDLHSYFIQAFDLAPATNLHEPELLMAAGYDAPGEIPTIYDLLNLSWSVVDWMTQLQIVQQLRDDPLIEERDFLETTAIKHAAAEPRAKLRLLMTNMFTPWSGQSGPQLGAKLSPANATRPTPIADGRRRPRPS